jgi:hypothetical protein
MVKIMLAKTIDHEIIRHAQNDHSDDRLLATFHTARGGKLFRPRVYPIVIIYVPVSSNIVKWTGT